VGRRSGGAQPAAWSLFSTAVPRQSKIVAVSTPTNCKGLDEGRHRDNNPVALLSSMCCSTTSAGTAQGDYICAPRPGRSWCAKGPATFTILTYLAHCVTTASSRPAARTRRPDVGLIDLINPQAIRIFETITRSIRQEPR